MKIRLKSLLLIMSALMLLLLSACGATIESEDKEKYSAKAEGVVKHLIAKEYEAITEQFDAQMKQALSIDMLKETEPLLAAAGEYVNVQKSTVQAKDNYHTAVLVVKFTNKSHIVTVSYNNSDQIAGLFIQ